MEPPEHPGIVASWLRAGHSRGARVTPSITPESPCRRGSHPARLSARRGAEPGTSSSSDPIVRCALGVLAVAAGRTASPKLAVAEPSWAYASCGKASKRARYSGSLAKRGARSSTYLGVRVRAHASLNHEQLLQGQWAGSCRARARKPSTCVAANSSASSNSFSERDVTWLSATNRHSGSHSQRVQPGSRVSNVWP